MKKAMATDKDTDATLHDPAGGVFSPVGGVVYLLPSALSAGDPREVLPARNIAIMRGLRHFVVENVRTTRRFLRSVDPSFPIDDCTFTELNEHTGLSEVEAMLAPVLAGEPVGLISEAGCPAVADPGASLVAAAQRRGIRVVPLVGPSSILMALMASGFDGQSFTFNGYLPVDEGARTRAIRQLERLAAAGTTQIFIETPYRNNRLLQSLVSTLAPQTLLCVAADITGADECIRTLPAREWRTIAGKTDLRKTPTIFLIGTSAARP